MEQYSGSIDVQFEGMPSIRLESFIPPEGAGVLERLAIATRRRRFSLREDWSIELGHIDYSANLNGRVEIPQRDGGDEPVIFDGASIPLPWLISLLTVGILRPLGVVLVGSIVHDYAYKYGKLSVIKPGNDKTEVPLERHMADKLFRDIIGTINGLPAVGYIAWFFVRIGWLGVKYNNKRFGGKPPVVEISLLLLMLYLIVLFSSKIGFSVVLSLLVCAYLIFYIVSLGTNAVFNSRSS